MKDKKKIIETSFLEHEGRLYEQVGEEGVTHESEFVEYDVLEERSKFVRSVTIGEVVYIPPRGDLVRNGVIFLPTNPEQYGGVDELINVIEEFIRQFVDVSALYLKISAYYVILSWVYDCFETLPYLRVLGDFGTGKTRFQQVVGAICYKPMFASGATTVSPIFRIIDLYKGTLVLDEGDLRFSDATVDMVKILNTGYSKGTPVLRTEGDKKRVPTSYHTFGPKIIGTRRRWQDKALESRCLTEVMRGSTRTDIPLHLPKDFKQQALNLRNKLLQFRFDHFGRVEVDLSLAVPKIEPRINQIVVGLLSLIQDEQIRAEVVEFIKEYAGELKASRGEELSALILQSMCGMVSGGEDLMIKKISEKINSSRDSDLGEKAISPALIGRINTNELNFKTRKVNGVTEIMWSTELAENLCRRYGVEMPTVNKVDDIEEVEAVKEELF